MAALQTVFVGFAAGLMLMIALTELPDACVALENRRRTSRGVSRGGGVRLRVVGADGAKGSL